MAEATNKETGPGQLAHAPTARSAIQGAHVDVADRTTLFTPDLP